MLTNEYNLPRPLVRALERDPYSSGDSDISVSRLVQPPRKVELDRLHKAEIVEDASDALYRLYGQIAHVILERAADDSIAERRLFTECLGWKVSGAADLVTEDGKTTIVDYKFVSVWTIKDGHKDEWIWQLRLLRLLAERNGVVIHGLQNVVLFRDWRPSESSRYADWYPPKVLIMPVELVTFNEDEALMEELVSLHQQARKELPECSDEDRWLRKGKYVRCESYCSAEPWCSLVHPELTHNQKG